MQSYREQPEMQITRTRPLQDVRVPIGIVGILTFIWVFLSITPLPPNDLWWHMAAGRTMLHEGALLTENRWAYTLPASAPYIYQSWLSEILMYGIWKLGGIPMLSLARMIFIAGSYGVIAWHTARHTGNTKATFYTLILAILVGFSNWTLRPQTIALLPGALFLAVLGEFLDGRLRPRTCAIALPLLMVLWVNIHGSFVLGIALIVLALGGKAIERVRKIDTHTSLQAIALAFLLTLVAAMANPLGWGIFTYVRGMLQNTALQRWFIEWQPPRPSLNILDPDARFFLLILFVMFLLAQGKNRPSLTHTLWFCALAWLSFSGIRYVMWFGLLCSPLIAQLIGPYLPKAPAGAPQPKASALQLGICATLLVAALPWFQLNLLMGAGSSTLFASQGSYRTLIADTTPIGAGEWLAQHTPTSGRMWTNITYASYLEWQTPEIQQFTDLRVELFPVDIWEQSFAIAAAKDDGMALIDRWQINTLLLDRRRDTKLLDRIKATPGWCERYTDRDAQIFQRCTS